MLVTFVGFHYHYKASVGVDNLRKVVTFWTCHIRNFTFLVEWNWLFQWCAWKVAMRVRRRIIQKDHVTANQLQWWDWI